MLNLVKPLFASLPAAPIPASVPAPQESSVEDEEILQSAGTETDPTKPGYWIDAWKDLDFDWNKVNKEVYYVNDMRRLVVRLARNRLTSEFIISSRLNVSMFFSGRTVM